MAGQASRIDAASRLRRSAIVFAIPLCAAWLVPTPGAAETIADALVKAYQSNPQLNAERARQRATDENVPQALAG